MPLMSRGFTLMELLVSMFLASLLTLSALTFLGNAWSTHHRLLVSCQQNSSGLLENIRRVHPYQHPDARR